MSEETFCKLATFGIVFAYVALGVTFLVLAATAVMDSIINWNYWRRK